MKKLVIIFSCLALIFAFSNIAVAAKGGKNAGCTTIQDGTLTDSKGFPITVGYDQWGYNYQGQLFNGFYGNYLRPSPPVTEGDSLMMKWNDAWLSNTDCDGDGKLDRHFGFTSYIGSGAWLTNHMSGTYEDNGNECHYVYFVKIVAAPADAYVFENNWYTADGKLIGPVIWGEFAIIQEISNDSCTGDHGVLFKSPVGPGFGKFKP